jgi:hypothetical protein
VWVGIWNLGEVQDGSCERLDTAELFGPGAIRCDYTDQNIVQDRNLTPTRSEHLVVHYKADDFEQHPPNLAVKDFTRAGFCSANLRGPIFVLKGLNRPRTWGLDWFDEMTPKDLRGGFRDMTMRDVRTAADYFTSVSRDGVRTTEPGDVNLLASGVFCASDMDDPRDKWQDIPIRGGDFIFGAAGSGIANLLGIPIAIRHIEGFEGIDANRDVSLLLTDISCTTVELRQVIHHARPFWSPATLPGVEALEALLAWLRDHLRRCVLMDYLSLSIISRPCAITSATERFHA